MKLVAYETGQILFAIHMDEVRPLSGLYLPDLINRMGDRYAFAGRPTDLVESAKSGAKFQVGRLQRDRNTIAIKQLDLYNDGVLITTSTTDDTEGVFSDVSSWLQETFNFREPISSFKRKYFSTVVVDFEKPLEPLLKMFAEISTDYAKALKSENNVDIVPNIYRIGFAADPRGLPQFTQTQFLIERRNDSDWTANRYFATAPLSTRSLMSLLERIESRL